MEMCYTLDKTKDNYNILRVNKNNRKMYIGSKYRENEENYKIIEEQGIITENTNYIVFGIGTGNLIRELIKRKDKNSKIIIVEVDKELLKFVREKKIVDDLIKRDDIIITTEVNGMLDSANKIISEMNVEFLKIIESTNYSKLYSKELEEYFIVIKDFIVKVCVERNTRKRFSVEWYYTLLENMKFYTTGKSIFEYKNKYKGKPAIIVSAGPSLNRNIDLLKNNTNNIILTGGRPLKALCERNIKADFLAIVDAGESSFNIVKDWIDSVECPLLMNETTNSKATQKHKGEKIVTARNKFIKRAFDDKIDSVDYGGSVAHSMTYFAMQMGCDPIIFIGQDLAYTNDKGHADGIDHGENNMNGYGREDDIYVDDIYGNKVRTSLVLNVFRTQFEEIIKGKQDVTFINATEGGANISGTIVMKLQDVLDKYCVNAFGKTVVVGNEDKNRKIKIVNELENILLSMKESKKVAKEAIKVFKEYKTAYYSNKNGKLNDLNRKLNKLETRLKASYANAEILSDLEFDVMYTINNNEKYLINLIDSKSEVIKKRFDKNEDIYVATVELMDIVIPKMEYEIKKLLQ
ncbi:6-hydroxymethylpterin diphosphokinase MptE-like protein [Clostridium sp.]|uniref:motility associated factor glycosyltransferase family protein n=1 Tax=Clostridium sp. TaxID=1506 RepID=UPI0032175AAC